MFRRRSTTPSPHDRRCCCSPQVATSYWESRTNRDRTHAQCRPSKHGASTGPERRCRGDPSSDPEISPFELRLFHLFTPERFHALLNSLFRVLFNFPSRYLFTIGLVVVFSLRRSLPPALGCTFKQPDSTERAAPHVLRRPHGPCTLFGQRGRRFRSDLDTGMKAVQAI